MGRLEAVLMSQFRLWEVVRERQLQPRLRAEVVEFGRVG